MVIEQVIWKLLNLISLSAHSKRLKVPLSSPPLQSLQSIHAHPYLQHPSGASAIEDALARAQTEAAMWRQSFEKAQKMALEANERYSDLVNGVTGAESVKPTSMLF